MTTVDIKKLFNYWYTETDYSWEAAESLFKNDKYSEALFFGHLAVEKILKANVVAETKQHAPPIHDLLKLSKLAMLQLTQTQHDEIEFFSKFYLSCRYDNYKMGFRKQCTKKFTEENMAKMKKYYLWFKEEAKNKFRAP